MNDGDLDGLTVGLETILGTDTSKSDTDQDGIIDGLEVYGAIDVPFPALGADPLRRTVVVEVDHMTGVDVGSERLESIRSANFAIDESEVDLIVLTGELSTYTVEECHLEGNWFSGYTWICEPTEEPVLPIINQSTATSMTAQEISHPPDHDTDPAFDLRYLPFSRRSTWTDGTSVHASVRGRFAMLGGPGAGFLHELGHLMGLRHGGAETSDYDQPNYWSVMNEGYRSFEVRLAGYGVIPVRSGHQLLYTGRDAHGRMRFSNGSMIALDEKALSEEAGYTGGHCVDPPACTDYVNPLSLEGVIPPDLMHDYMVGIEFGSHTLNEFEDVEVGWQDFDLDDQFDSQPYGHNIDYSCRPAENGGWENMRTGATGTESVCWDEFDVNNDIDFLNNGEWADHIKGTKWWCHHNNGTLDAQRNEMGLPDWQEI